MSIYSWLQNLRSARAPGRAQRQHAHRGSKRASTHRPSLESLEDRLTPSFSPATSFPVGWSPQAVVTGDFNNDGHLDLATFNLHGDTVSVLLGDGRGGFGTAIDPIGTPYSGFFHASLTIADFNNDGKLDLAAVYSDYEAYPNGWLGVLLGNGDGTFQPVAGPGALYVPVSAAAGDFNNDGNSDLVVTEDDLGSSGVVEVLLGNGRGGFTRMPWHGVSWPTMGATVADLNLDGNLDAVAVGAGVLWGGGSNGYAMLGNGDGTFGYSEFATSQDPRAVAVGDFTGEGIPDLVVAGQAVDVLTGRGNGTFDWPIAHSANGSVLTGVAVGDFNGDGKLDAVTSDSDTGTVSELRGNGDGTLTYAGAYAVGPSPTAVAVGDFNGDGRPDVVVADGGSNTVSVLLNNGIWTPPPPPPPPPPTIRIHDATVTEGNTGTVEATFSVTLSAPSTETITVAYATGHGTATAGSDYEAANGTLTFAPGETSKTITIMVNGDRLPEPNETVFVNLSGATNATIADGQGVGTILDDEPRISISDVTKAEGKKNQTTLFIFTVTLSAPYDQPVTMSFQTVNGTAKTSDNDYVARAGTVTFAPGETTKTITIEVKGDNKKEANEYFYLDLFANSSNSWFTKNRGLGTILNDD
jgi:hypothetical protein